MRTVDISAFGLNLWGIQLPWPVLFLWMLLGLFLLTGTMPARHGLRGISRAERPFSYWISFSLFAFMTLLFTAFANPEWLFFILGLLR